MGLFLLMSVNLELETARSGEDSAVETKLVHFPWIEEASAQIRYWIAHRIDGVGVHVQQVIDAKGQATLFRHRIAKRKIGDPLCGKSLILRGIRTVLPGDTTEVGICQVQGPLVHAVVQASNELGLWTRRKDTALLFAIIQVNTSSSNGIWRCNVAYDDRSVQVSRQVDVQVAATNTQIAVCSYQVKSLRVGVHRIHKELERSDLIGSKNLSNGGVGVRRSNGRGVHNAVIDVHRVDIRREVDVVAQLSCETSCNILGSFWLQSPYTQKTNHRAFVVESTLVRNGSAGNQSLDVRHVDLVKARCAESR